MRRLLKTVFVGISLVVCALPLTIVGQEPGPSLVTDRSDYFVGDTVTLAGTNLTPLADYQVVISLPDGTTETLNATADGDGSFTVTWVFPGLEGDYHAALIDALGNELAEAHFHGSHFRYGHLTWRPIGPRTAEFTLTNAFRRTGYSGSGGDGRPVTGDIITEFVGGTSLNFGDGATTGTLQYEVTAFDAAADWVLGRAILPNHSYASDGPFTAGIDSCCRISTLQNSSNGVYRVQTVVRFDMADSSPVSSLPPIVNAPVNTPGFSFTTPAVDAEGDALSFRLATAAESGISEPDLSPPAPNALSVDSASGVVSWDTTGTTVGHQYTTQIVIEESRGGGVIGRSAVDFILNMVANLGSAPTCELNPATTSYTVAPGDTVTFTVTGHDVDAGDTVTLNTGGIPAGATLAPGLPLSGPTGTSTTFSWTPGAGDQGSANAVSFTVTDSNGLAVQCAVTINIPLNDSPIITPPAAATINEGDTFSGQGSFTDPDSSSWTATVDYGDGSGPQPLALNPDGTFNVSHTYADDGVYTATVTVSDGLSPTASATFQVTVLNVAPVVTAPPDASISVGDTFTGGGSFTDPGADTWVGTVDYGDGAGPQPLALNPDMTFALSHTYAAVGTFTVTVMVVDDEGGAGSDTTEVEVAARSAVAPFVIGDLTDHTVGATVNYWGPQWEQNNPLSWGRGPTAFKGHNTTPAELTCGDMWTSRVGNSSDPPATVPAQIAVIVSSNVVQDGPVISGNIEKILLVDTQAGYGPAPGHSGYGRVVSVVCSR